MANATPEILHWVCIRFRQSKEIHIDKFACGMFSHWAAAHKATVFQHDARTSLSLIDNWRW